MVLDDGPYAAFRASGRMNGSVYLGSNRSAKAMKDAHGEKVARALYNYSNRNNRQLQELISSGLPCDAEFNGGFRMASTAKEAKELDDSAKLLSSWGFHPARFDHNESQHVMVVPYTKGSLFVPGEGMIDPFAYCNKLARILRKNNIWVVYNTRVTKNSVASDGNSCITLSNGHTITAGKVVHTTTQTVPCERVIEKIVYRREHAVRTQPLSSDLDDMPLPLMPIELGGGLDSVRMYDRSVIMTGGKVGLKRDPDLYNVNDTSYNERILGQLDNVMMHNFPITNHMEISHQWTYVETELEDCLPLMGELPDYAGHYVNIGHGRNKFGLAFLGARNIAEKILRVKMSSPDEFKIFDPKRLTRGE
jgi:glycine/D-amino acid oxidase-like deaminating enzyme